MVRIETTGRKQYAVLWAAASTYTSVGQRRVSSPVEIQVRWEDREYDALDEQGETIRLDTLVVVDQDIAINSLMWLGRLVNWTATSGELREVKVFSKVPNLKGTRYRRTVGLKRYSDSLPPIAT